MIVKDIMTRDVICVNPDTPLSMVARLLYDHNLTGMPVVDEQGKLVGIVTEYDLMSEEGAIHIPTFVNLLSAFRFESGQKKHVDEELKNIRNTKVKDVMSRDVVTVLEQTGVQEVAKLFTEKHINPIPVIDIHSRVVGVVSRADIVKLFKDAS